MLVDTPARFRTNRTTLLAVAAFAICLTTLTAASPWFLLVLVVPALLGDSPFSDHDDPVGAADRRQAMGDDERRPPFRQLRE